MVVLEGAERVLTMLRTAGRDAGDDRDVLRDEAVVGQRGLKAHIRPAHQAVGHQERVWLRLPIRRSESVQAPAELNEVPAPHPPRQLPPEVSRIDVTREKEARIEYGLVPYDREHGWESHRSNMPSLICHL
jgi:hypothetical protein